MKTVAKDQENYSGMGLAIGMSICVGIALSLNLIWGFHDVFFWGIVLGSSTGVALEKTIERRYQKSNGLKEKLMGMK